MVLYENGKPLALNDYVENVSSVLVYLSAFLKVRQSNIVFEPVPASFSDPYTLFNVAVLDMDDDVGLTIKYTPYTIKL